MKFSEILNRLTGISTPIVGISWNPPPLEVNTARKVITFLEDRRVLYAPSEMEMPSHCIDSIIEIRQFLTEQLSNLEPSSELGASLRAMRTSCRKFLDTIGVKYGDIVRFAFHNGHWASWVFLGALGELRGVFGIHLAKIAAQYKIDIEDDLSAILPAIDDYEQSSVPANTVLKPKTTTAKPKKSKRVTKSTKRK